MQNPVFYGAFLAISWIKPRSVVTNYSECMRSNSAYRDAYVTRSQTQSLVCLWIFYQKRTSSLFLTQMNARGIERYSKHSSPTFLRRPLNCAVFHFFCDLLPAFYDPRTMPENREHVSCDENAQNGNTGMFVTK